MCIYFLFTKKIHAHNSSLIWFSWGDYCQAFNSWSHKFINNNKRHPPCPQDYSPTGITCVSLSVSVSLQRFTSKQDVIRHYNMHKKRDNSLQHGFMRFSPLDDCSVYYHGCHLNGKSTHYHCMQVTAAQEPPCEPGPFWGGLAGFLSSGHPMLPCHRALGCPKAEGWHS